VPGELLIVRLPHVAEAPHAKFFNEFEVADLFDFGFARAGIVEPG
jgi:hypothetical protein